ncbi:MAG: hypothetical protein KJO66_01970 [Gammaproteobacteria bacterium]|nr:hypothetical protein [Gammaproteobacteria bacterium]
MSRTGAKSANDRWLCRQSRFQIKEVLIKQADIRNIPTPDGFHGGEKPTLDHTGFDPVRQDHTHMGRRAANDKPENGLAGRQP